MQTITRNLLCLLALTLLSARIFAQHNFHKQRVIVIMMDGFGEQYYRNSSMPFLNQMEKQGIYKIVPSLMPSVTMVNNMSIATGTTPEQNGITGNVYFDEHTQSEKYIEAPALLLTPSILEMAHNAGMRTALFSVKKKTIDIMESNADYACCPECEVAGENKGMPEPLHFSGVYSKEVNYQLFGAADRLLATDTSVRLIYIHTSDYPMHMWAPESDSAKDFLAHIDQCVQKLHETAPDASILITADHGMNHKTMAWDIAQVCIEKKVPVKAVISPEKDRYIKHHKGLGGAAYVYLSHPKDSVSVRKILQHLKGIDAIFTRQEAAARFHLMPERIGDFMIIGDKNTVFGNLNGKSSEKEPENYRSHGSLYEAQVPLWVFNAEDAPNKNYFTWNYKLTAWLFN